MFAALRKYGVIILDIQNKEADPIKVGEYFSGNSEGLSLSLDNKHVIVSDGFRGVSIINIEDISNPRYVKSVLVSGSPTKMNVDRYGD